MSIYKKLLTIQQHVNGLKKNAKSFGYEFVSGTKVLSEIKPLMNAQGLLLKQEVLSCHNQRIDYTVKSGSKSEMFSSVALRFTWVDCETGEKDENLFHANGQNDWEKGLGSALTYAERYFLLKYFHIATDEDDIDNPERKTSAPVQVAAPVPTPKVKADLNPSHPKWEAAKKAVSEGTTTVADIEKAYTLTAANAELLTSK
jgi:hypothetical protein